VRKALPDVQKNIEDFGAASRNWARLGERLNVWAQGNLENVTKAIENANTVLTRLSSVLNEENQRNLMVILKNTRAASERFNSISRNLDGILEDSRPLPKHMNDSLNRADETMADIRKAAKPFSERGDSISRNLDESLVKINRSSSDLSALMQVLDQDGTIQRLLKDPSLYNRLDEAACGLVRSLPRMDRILKDFETFADKLARHPELLGVRGAVRPSSGLKEPPPPYQPQIIAPGP
jgi:phospholipid/cholesterol/gamma-HCH transport system substrate-binding protein